ncbi:MAG: hypothetical protein HOK56_09800, partial [Deltaproteobacteria bacterium]|nr:hypothetical protein [Deltaproteobacteria bacterium]
MKFGIVLFTLLILSNNFSFVFAQSMYDFKGKDTNISPLYPNTNSNRSSSNRSSSISEDSQNIKYPSKIRFRYLTGTYSSEFQEATSSISSIIWDGVGIGQSVFKNKTSHPDKSVDLENTMIDLSYTFGDEYTLTLGSSAIYSGKFIGTTSDSQKYNSTNVFGYGHFSIFGVEYGIFEILLGYQYIKYAYLDLES